MNSKIASEKTINSAMSSPFLFYFVLKSDLSPWHPLRLALDSEKFRLVDDRRIWSCLRLCNSISRIFYCQHKSKTNTNS